MSSTILSKFVSLLRPRSSSYDAKTASSSCTSIPAHNEPVGNTLTMQSQQKILSRASLTEADIQQHDIRVLNHISDDYTYSPADLINDGASAKVYRATRCSDGQLFALKLTVVEKALHRKLFLNEITTLRRLDHPNIIRLVDAVVDGEFYGLVLPLCCGGTLTSVAETPMPEKRAGDLVMTILEIVSYLHAQGMVHRDLKPDNLVFADEDQTKLVLIDLADAIVVDPSANYTDIAGTLLYWAPEVFRMRLGSELFGSDVWSVGVIAYQLLTGVTPFDAQDGAMKKVMANIFMNRYEMPSSLSQHAQDFIRACLCANIAKRVTASQAMTLPFLCAISLDASPIDVDLELQCVWTPSWSVEEEE